MKVLIVKPDGIGDFVLAQGAIRRLALEFGEESLTLAVLPQVAALAQMQFPLSSVLTLPMLSERKILNLFVANFLRILPAWISLLLQRFDIAISLRYQRNYLVSFLFYSLRARKRILTENMFSFGKANTRNGVEVLLQRLRRVTCVHYPPSDRFVPIELEAHRRTVSEALGKEILPEEILPRLLSRAADEHQGILLCPLSSTPQKDYPSVAWAEAFTKLPESLRQQKVRLVGAPWQKEALSEYQNELGKAGCSHLEVVFTPDVPALVDLANQSSLVLTVDTAAAHIACALDRPAVILFSGLHRGVYAPWQSSNKQIWLEPTPPAAKEPPRKKRHWHRGIAPESVANAILQKLRDPAL